MNRNHFALALVAAVMVVGASWLGAWAQPGTLMADLHPRAPLADVMPERFAGWVQDHGGANVQLPPDVEAQIKSIYTETVARGYVNASW